MGWVGRCWDVAGGGSGRVVVRHGFKVDEGGPEIDNWELGEIMGQCQISGWSCNNDGACDVFQGRVLKRDKPRPEGFSPERIE